MAASVGAEGALSAAGNEAVEPPQPSKKIRTHQRMATPDAPHAGWI